MLAVLNGIGFVELQPKAALYAADIIGGLIPGIGITLAGACPGMTLAQVGVGCRDALFTLAGGLLGTVAFSYAQPWLSASFLAAGGGKITFPDLLGIPYSTGALGFAAICACLTRRPALVAGRNGPGRGWRCGLEVP